MTRLRIAYLAGSQDDAMPRPWLADALAAFGDVTGFLFERRRRTSFHTTRFLPPRRFGAGLPGHDAAIPSLGEALRMGEAAGTPWQRLSEPAALIRHIMNARRAQRLFAALHRLRPSLIVVDGAVLAPLFPTLRSLGCPLVWAPDRRGSLYHAAQAEALPEGWLASWHGAAAAAHAEGEALAAPLLDQLWLTGDAAEEHFADLVPAARRHAVGGSAEGMASAMRAMSLPARPAPPPAPSRVPDAEQLSFNPLTRLAWWRLSLRDAQDARISLLDSHGATLPAATVTIHRRRAGAIDVEAMAVLPAGVSAEELRLDISTPRGAMPALSPAAPAVEQRAGLVALEPFGAWQELWAWSLDEKPGLHPRPEQSAILPLPARPGSGSLHRLRFALRDQGEAVTLTPPEGIGEELSHPALWTGRHPPSSARLRAMAGRHQGETAWIIGNGPSVRPEDLDALQGRVTFCFNRFHLAHGRTSLRPRYTVSADRQMIEDFGAEMVSSSGGTVFLAAKEPPALEGDYIWVRQLPVFPPLFSLRADIAVTPGGSSPYVAMQLGYFMGIRRFILYGTDFNYRFSDTGSQDPYRAATGDGNHFIKNYRGGRDWAPPSLRAISAAFLNARRVTEAAGGFIRNASRGGHLDIFERQSFESALALH
ncbi:hypothetical protein EOD42_23400 [Rhodovarius crocodyli]|uniref:DUF115 domain-containing protein n=1 Tax=Rhodovarius crocodyli TaxID=1979269 RepID=A0A437LYT6_9PROT|nr:hypothetical protein [Rhodovarius crocodyli]RVT90581.1 hypothetical protein EOD42_23400 [Rhodovarius crocodyli]